MALYSNLYSEKIGNQVLVLISLGLVLRDFYSTTSLLGDKTVIKFGYQNSSLLLANFKWPVNIFSCDSLEGIIYTKLIILQAF